MSKHTDDRIEELTALFAELPGIGPRSASRIVGELLTQRRELAVTLAKSLERTASMVCLCECCHTLSTQPICPVCSQEDRDHGMICVVETPADLTAIEESVAYRGMYFVLMGRVNPMKGIGPDELGVNLLIKRIQTDAVREVVIATSFTPEGETTAQMLIGVLKKHAPTVRITRLSRGLPTGVEVEYTDAASIAAAVTDRCER